MRGDEECQDAMVVFESLEDQVPLDHPLRPIRRMVDRAFSEMSPLFDSLYAPKGRVSIPPECLLRAQVLQVLYAIPSERKFCEHLQYHLLFRWFVGLRFSDRAWHPTSFTKNRNRLLTPEVAGVFFERIREQAEAKKLLSPEHFSVDGTLIEAAASLKSFRPKEEKEGEGGDDDTPPTERAATLRSTSTGSGAATRPTLREPTPTPGWPAKAGAKKPSSATPAISSSRTATASASTARWPRPRVRPKRRRLLPSLPANAPGAGAR
ncbi:MAG: hypothetical protein Kow00122_21240 [Thermoleophilia bacterium]